MVVSSLRRDNYTRGLREGVVRYKHANMEEAHEAAFAATVAALGDLASRLGRLRHLN